MEAPPPIRVGLVGCGTYGRQAQLPLLLALGSCRVTALANRSPDPLQEALKMSREAGHDPATYSQWAQVMHDPQVDAVVAALPPSFNGPLVKMADELGKPILIEKPVASSLQDLQEVQKVARRRRIHIQVGTQLLFGSWFKQFEAAIEAMGELVALNCLVYGDDRWELEPMTWKVDRDASGGLLNSWGAHVLTMMLKLAARQGRDAGWDADYAELSAFAGTAFDREGVDPSMYDSVSAGWLTLGPGDTAVPCHLSYCAHPDVRRRTWRLEAICTAGRIDGDVIDRTICTLPRGRSGPEVLGPGSAGRGAESGGADSGGADSGRGPCDSGRRALEFFLDRVREGSVDQGTLQVAGTACRFALEVNVNPTSNGDAPEPNDAEPDRRPPKRSHKKRSRPDEDRAGPPPDRPRRGRR